MLVFKGSHYDDISIHSSTLDGEFNLGLPISLTYITKLEFGVNHTTPFWLVSHYSQEVKKMTQNPEGSCIYKKLLM